MRLTRYGTWRTFHRDTLSVRWRAVGSIWRDGVTDLWRRT